MDKQMEDLAARKILEVGDYLFKKYKFRIPASCKEGAFNLLAVSSEDWWTEHKDDGPEDLLRASSALSW